MSNLEKIKALAKTRGFFWPSAEIYGNVAGLWNYGPLGTSLKQNLIQQWRKWIVKRDGMLEMDGCQIMPEAVFQSSGHLSSFQDPLTECKKCKSIFRADKLIEKTAKQIIPEALPAEEFDMLLKKHKIVCEKCKSPLGDVKMFNLMIAAPVGPKKNEPAYLRPESCQSIFVDFPQVFRSMRAKLPIGIAQVGKSFRNEISPRQAIIRTREFTHAEVEVFFNPEHEDGFEKYDSVKKFKLPLFMDGSEKIEQISCEDGIKKKILVSKIEAYYLSLIIQFLESLKIPRKNIRLREVGKDEKPFYAKSAWDLEILTSLGWIEIIANHYRTDHDLKSHSKGSKKDLQVIDSDKKVLPWVWEDSMGVDRLFYCLMDIAYTEDKVGGEERVVLKLPEHVAPYRVAVFPLVKKGGLKEKAEEVFSDLNQCFPTFLDISGSIGKRYRRMDEVGCPFCITVDHQTLEDDSVTVRERDSTKQERVKISELKNFLWKKVV